MPLLSKTQPRPYQERIYKQFKDSPLIIFSVAMGGGKTKMVGDLCHYHQVKRGLILCPEKVVSVWPQEFELHSLWDGKFFLANGSKESKIKMIQEAHNYDGNSILVIPYDTAWREPFNSALCKYGFDTVILDESHLIKNPKSRRGRFAVRVGKQAIRRYACSGTVMADRHVDVFNQAQFISESIFGRSIVRFRDQYCIMGGFEGKQILGSKNEDDLAIKLAPYWAEVTAEEVEADRLGFSDENVLVDLKPSTKKLYTKFKKEMILRKDDQKVLVASNTLEQALRLREITSGFIHWQDKQTLDKIDFEVIDDSKIQAFKTLIQSLPVSEPLVVFAHSRYDIQALHEACHLYGRTTSELSGTRNELIEWQNGESNTLVVQIRSGSVGISLVRAAINIYYSMSYSLAEYEQSRKRSYRAGQDRFVTYYHIVARGTLDEAVLVALQTKRNIMEVINKELKSVQRA